MASIEAGQIEMMTALGTERHITEIRKEYSDENLEAVLRGRMGAYAAAFAQLVGPQAAFETFSRLADTEMLLLHPDRK